MSVVGRIGGVGSHWLHTAKIKGSSKTECLKIMFE